MKIIVDHVDNMDYGLEKMNENKKRKIDFVKQKINNNK